MKLTRIVIASITAALIAFDIWTLIAHGTASTISWTLYTWSESYPAIPFGIGFVMGHLFWVQHGA